MSSESMDKNAFVKDQPKVCFRDHPSPICDLTSNFAKASMPMTPKNTQNGGGGDRNALRVPVMEDGLRGWSYDIFDCFADRRTCMCGLRSTTLSSTCRLQYPNSLVISGALSCCCCCYVYSRNKRRFEHLERHGTPLREPVERYNRDCRWHCLLAPALQVRLSFPSP